MLACTVHLGLALVGPAEELSQVVIGIVHRVSLIPDKTSESLIAFLAIALAHGELVVHLPPLHRAEISSSERRCWYAGASAEGVQNPLENLVFRLLEVIDGLLELFSGLATNLSSGPTIVVFNLLSKRAALTILVVGSQV